MARAESPAIPLQGPPSGSLSASQALCTVFPTPVSQLLTPPLSQIREIRQFTAQMPSPLGALSCPSGRSLHFLISIPI